MAATATIRDGSPVVLRPVAPSDKDLLARGFERLSHESRYRRFLTPMKELSRSMLRYLTEVDHHSHEGVIAIDPETGNAVGIARYVCDRERPGVAEAAVTVVDDWQGRGLGTLLLEVVAGRAHDEGITRFTARALATNDDMIDLLERLGDVRVVDRDAGAVELEVELPRGALPPPLRGLLRLCAQDRVAAPSLSGPPLPERAGRAARTHDGELPRCAGDPGRARRPRAGRR